MLELQVQQKIDKVNQRKKEQLLLPDDKVNDKVPEPHLPPPKQDQKASLFTSKPMSNSYSTRDFAATPKTGAQYVEYNESKEATPVPNPAPLAPAASRYRDEEDGDDECNQ